MSEIKELRYIKGVGPKREYLLNRLGIYSVDDLLHYFPVKYEDRTHLVDVAELQEGKADLILADCIVIKSRRSFKTRKTVTEAVFADESGQIPVTWFNQPYITNNIEAGNTYYLYGKPRIYKGHMQMVSPAYDRSGFEEDGVGKCILPLYSLTEGLKQSALRKVVELALQSYNDSILEFLPQQIIENYRFDDRLNALKQIHFPSDLDSLKKARERFIFEEFFLMQLTVFMRKQQSIAVCGDAIEQDTDFLRRSKANFPHKLTDSQVKVLLEVLDDLSKPHKASRLLQGDVGSGKTIVSFLAALQVVNAGYQVACMAPTEVLAMQHIKTLESLIDGLDIKIAYLGSATKAKDKKDIYQGLADGSIDIVVGTQTLLQDELSFKNLRFVIIDEQHRFGVCQRAVLAQKGERVDLLVMSATPIPRSLSLTMYGDLDVSKINEYPQGRKLPSSAIIPERYRERVYKVIDKKINEGRQAYVVYALVEEDEESDLKSAEEMHKVLSKRFASRKVGLLHGRLKSDDKQKVIDAFRNKRIDILVSTLVVEVGVDVPNATLMMVENPERFGLAQLHQLRGRIMRSNNESFFYMMTKSDISAKSKDRLEVIENSCDGFEIAEADLKQRGPGDVFGIMQSGYIENKIADVERDFEILEKAREEAEKIITNNDIVGADLASAHEQYKTLFEMVKHRNHQIS